MLFQNIKKENFKKLVHRHLWLVSLCLSCPDNRNTEELLKVNISTGLLDRLTLETIKKVAEVFLKREEKEMAEFLFNIQKLLETSMPCSTVDFSVETNTTQFLNYISHHLNDSLDNPLVSLKLQDKHPKFQTYIRQYYSELIHDIAFQFPDSVKNIYSQKNKSFADLRYDHAFEMFKKGQLGYALYYCDQALKIYKKYIAIFKYKEEESACFSLAGYIYYLLGDYQRSIIFCEQGLILIEKTQYEAEKIVLLNRLGYAHVAISEYKKGIEYYQQSLTLAKKIENKGIN